MQEMWLFGQLNTLGESEVQQQTDDNARLVGELLAQVMEMQKGGRSANAAEGTEAGVANGTS